eukprot:COSAG01_NODE_9222_length_2514_cov_1.659213_1_plen_42_part_00
MGAAFRTLVEERERETHVSGMRAMTRRIYYPLLSRLLLESA